MLAPRYQINHAAIEVKHGDDSALHDPGSPEVVRHGLDFEVTTDTADHDAGVVVLGCSGTVSAGEAVTIAKVAGERFVAQPAVPCNRPAALDVP